MEKLLRKGKARFIYATNTLAQGVNLGVSTIIIMGVVQGQNRNLPKSDFWNMAGRAGRAFVDTEGKILFVCDCSEKKDWHLKIAHDYIDNLVINKAESGVCKRLEQLCQIQRDSGIDLEYFLQLIAENNLADLTEQSRDFISDMFELLDDSLLALDIASRDSESDAVDWVDDHFRHSLAIIQQNDKDLRDKYILMIKARVKAIRIMTQGNIIPQTFVSSGIPIKAALYLENKMTEIIQLVGEYLDSSCDTEAMISFFRKFDVIMDYVDSKRIKLIDKNIRCEEMYNWLLGKPINGKSGAEVSEYYSLTISWILNALANRFASEGNDCYKYFFETMSLIANYGVPSKWAAQIYLCGVHSRIAATELSNRLVGSTELDSLSEIASYVKRHSERIMLYEQCSELTKGWIRILVKEKKVNNIKVSNVPNFHFSKRETEIPELLFCRRCNGVTFLCSDDMQYKISVNDTYKLRFSEIADIPGIFFKKENDVWNMHNVNPYVEIV